MSLKKSSLETARCNLRSPRVGDRKQFLVLNSDSQVRKFLGGPRSAAQIEERFSSILVSREMSWVVEQKTDCGFIGIISLDRHLDGVETQISYEFLPSYWGQGFATETVERVLDYALHELQLPRIIAETQLANDKSRRLLERVGMHFDCEVERFGARQAIYATSLKSNESSKE